jgi:hypothetical protein
LQYYKNIEAFVKENEHDLFFYTEGEVMGLPMQCFMPCKLDLHDMWSLLMSWKYKRAAADQSECG